MFRKPDTETEKFWPPSSRRGPLLPPAGGLFSQRSAQQLIENRMFRAGAVLT